MKTQVQFGGQSAEIAIAFAEPSRAFDMIFEERIGAADRQGECLTLDIEEQSAVIAVLVDDPSRAFGALFEDKIEVESITGGDPYRGEYEVTPKTEAQTLPTKQKTMMRDLTVGAIPYYDVSNPAGGQTIFIGNEV